MLLAASLLALPLLLHHEHYCKHTRKRVCVTLQLGIYTYIHTWTKYVVCSMFRERLCKNYYYFTSSFCLAVICLDLTVQRMDAALLANIDEATIINYYSSSPVLILPMLLYLGCS